MAQYHGAIVNTPATGFSGFGSVLGAQGAPTSIQSQMKAMKGLNLKNLSVSGGIFGDSLQDYETNEFVKKYMVYDLQEDIVTLSVTSHRIKSTTGYYKLTDTHIFKSVTEEDREQAKLIREYYQKKFTYLGLTSHHRSKYREDLLNLLQNDGKRIPEEYFGIAYYLPLFYEYDCGRDYIKSEVITKGCKEQYKRELKTSDHIITPLKMLHRKTKRSNFNEYWFRTQDNYGFMLAVQVDNNLQSMIQYVFEQNLPISISGILHTKELDNFEYLTTSKFKVAKI